MEKSIFKRGGGERGRGCWADASRAVAGVLAEIVWRVFTEFPMADDLVV